jgi:hypothetical protein
MRLIVRATILSGTTLVMQKMDFVDFRAEFETRLNVVATTSSSSSLNIKLQGIIN